MASLAEDKSGAVRRFYIQLAPGEDPRRPKIRLGNVTKRDAQTAQVHIEHLCRARVTGAALPGATAEWLGNVPDSLRLRIEELHLAEKRARPERHTVADWVARYIAGRADAKSPTRRKWRDVEGKLSAFFDERCLDELTLQDGKAFRGYLKGAGLAENSIRRQIGIARQFFKAAVEARLIEENPFAGQPVSVRSNDSRFHYVTVEEAKAVLNACPDAEWRLIFGLCRFGGLRCPSEVLRLRWEDVNFDKQEFTVHSSKLEHHIGDGVRVVPMFPELQTLFLEASVMTEGGAEYCIHRYRAGTENLRTQLSRIVRRAGLTPWPKLFQNLRSTRETELFKLTGDVKAVCSWLGNSPQVALTHYAQVTEAAQKEALRLTVLDLERGGAISNPVHNPVQHAAAASIQETASSPEEAEEMPANTGDFAHTAASCGSSS